MSSGLPTFGAVLVPSMSPTPTPTAPQTIHLPRVTSSAHRHTPLTSKHQSFPVFLYNHQVLSRHTLSGAWPGVWAWAKGQWGAGTWVLEADWLESGFS